jgi:hypothetical protein
MKVLRRLSSYLLPAEALVIAGFSVFCLFLLAGFPFIYPSARGSEVLSLLGGTTKYLHILLFCIGLYAAIALMRAWLYKKWEMKKLARDLLMFLRLLICLLAALYMMLCFKWWSHLQGQLYDQFYWEIDLKFQGLKTAMMLAADWLGWSHEMYFRLFGLCFFLSYFISIGTKPEVFTRIITATCAVALIGGLSYNIAPAYGPFYIEPVTSYLAIIQQMMLESSQAFASAKGGTFDPEHFEVALGAMPSLHVAYTLMLTFYAFRVHWSLGIILSILASYVAMYAVVTRYHYLIDLPAGVLVASLAIALTEAFFNKMPAASAVFSKQPTN